MDQQLLAPRCEFPFSPVYLRSPMPLEQVMKFRGLACWGYCELRGAGFPVEWLADLVDSELAARVDELLVQATPEMKPGEELKQLFENGQIEVNRAILKYASNAKFREALVWQNRSALRGGVASVLRYPAETTNSQLRRKRRLVATYLQRYCAKNERAGFFGPTSLAQLKADGPAMRVTGSPTDIRRRRVYFEPWAMDALAEIIAEDSELRPSLFPRRLPTVRVQGSKVFYPVQRSTELPPEFLAVLKACTGTQSAREIAEQMSTKLGSEVSSIDQVYDLLEELVDNGLITWTLEMPTTGDHPEILLRRELERLEDSPARAAAFGKLNELEAGREVVQAACGTVEPLAAALDALDQTFVRITGAAAERNQGQTYAGRSISGHDCYRDIDTELGPELFESLAGPLRLLLTSARWFTYEIAQGYRAEFAVIFDHLCKEGQTDVVDYQLFAARLADVFKKAKHEGVVAKVVDELRIRWARVLEIEQHMPTNRVTLRSEDINEAVGREFAAPHPGWPSAIHHSPDLLLSAKSVEAICRGEFYAVLGEVHPGINTLLIPDLPHPFKEHQGHFLRRDEEISGPLIAPVWSHNRSRLDYHSRSPSGIDFENGRARSWRSRSDVLAVADLVVRRVDDKLLVVHRDTEQCFDIIAFHEHYLIAEAHSQFSPTGKSAYTPRMSIDGLVLGRETWTLQPESYSFVNITDTLERFVAARAWARELGLPRRIFLKVPQEIKPYFIDFDSPIFVDVAAKALRTAPTATISEMCPDVGDLWLEDETHQHYTNELRMVMIDDTEWVPA